MIQIAPSLQKLEIFFPNDSFIEIFAQIWPRSSVSTLEKKLHPWRVLQGILPNITKNRLFCVTQLSKAASKRLQITKIPESGTIFVAALINYLNCASHNALIWCPIYQPLKCVQLTSCVHWHIAFPWMKVACDSMN